MSFAIYDCLLFTKHDSSKRCTCNSFSDPFSHKQSAFLQYSFQVVAMQASVDNPLALGSRCADQGGLNSYNYATNSSELRECTRTTEDKRLPRTFTSALPLQNLPTLSQCHLRRGQKCQRTNNGCSTLKLPHLLL